MKKFKIIGFLVVVLFFGILMRQEVWALSCNYDSDCHEFCDAQEEGSFCQPIHYECDCIECLESKGVEFNANSHSCVSVCGTNEEWSQSLNQCQPKVGQTKCPDGYVSSGALGGCVKASSTPSSGGGTSSGSSGGGGAISTVSTVKGDQRCWTKDECITYRKNNFKPITDKEAEDGFYSAAEHSDAEKACGRMRGTDVMGFCAPGAIATTAIGFGTVRSFANFGDFIKYMYKYGFVIVSVLGVLMIIVAGIQWLTSAGSQEKIGAAKKRIMGAVIGILILALSYTILNTINPYLVNFRLPQVWILNTSSFAKEYCRDLPDVNKILFQEIGGPSDELSSDEIADFYAQNSFPLTYNQTSFTCGKQYIYNVAPNTRVVCRGDYVTAKNQICLFISGKGYVIKSGIIGGTIKKRLGNLFSSWDDEALDEDEIKLYAICKNGKYFEVGSAESMVYESGSGNQGAYSISVDDADLLKTINKCSNEKGIAGFLIRPELDKNVGLKFWDSDWDDEVHWLGKESNNTEITSDIVDLGNGSDFFSKIQRNDPEAIKYLIPTEYFQGDKAGNFKLNIDVENITVYSGSSSANNAKKNGGNDIKPAPVTTFQ